jgi:2-hydroxy-3-oxopropionate reductase
MNSGNEKDAITSVGVIGLGVMGWPISVNIAKEGFEVSGYDILPERIERLVANGGKAAGSAMEGRLGPAGDSVFRG